MATKYMLYRSRLLLVLLAAAAPAGCQSRNEFVPPPPPKVTVAQPIQQEIVDFLEFTGITKATAKVDLIAKVSGYLEQISFKDGGFVSKGDLLFVIDQNPFKAELNAAKAKVKKAKAALELAKANLQRSKRLLAKDAIAVQEVDVAKAEKETALAELAAAEAAVDTAQLRLDYTEIRAPLSGRIGRHLVDIGNLVESEETLLAKIESIDQIHAYFYLSENDLHRYDKFKQKYKIPSQLEEPQILFLGLSSGQGFPFKGALDFREVGVDPTTGTIMRRGIFPNPDHRLLPGMFVRIREPVGKAQPQVLVEERALSTDQRGDYLMVVNEKDTVEYRLVQLGIPVGNMRVIEKGIDTNDWVIVNGLQRARPGAKVDPQRAEMTTPEIDASLAGIPDR